MLVSPQYLKFFLKGALGYSPAQCSPLYSSLSVLFLACRSGRRRECPKRNIKEQQEREQEYLQVSQTSSPQPRARAQSQPWEMDARNRGKSVVELEGDEAYRAVELADMR